MPRCLLILLKDGACSGWTTWATVSSCPTTVFPNAFYAKEALGITCERRGASALAVKAGGRRRWASMASRRHRRRSCTALVGRDGPSKMECSRDRVESKKLQRNAPRSALRILCGFTCRIGECISSSNCRSSLVCSEEENRKKQHPPNGLAGS